MSQSIAVITDALPVLNVPGSGPAVLITTTGAIQYAPGMSLQTALAAHQAQIVESASAVARAEADLADVVAWLIEHLGYVKSDHTTEGSYLTPLFEEVSKTPTGGEA